MVAIGLVICLGVAASLADAEVRADRPSGRIAYSDGGICLVNADGSGKRRCLTRTSDNYAPVVWSPDGQWLAFERHYDSPKRDCCVEVLVVRADGRARVKLTPRGAEDAEPDWSPTAPRIAFTRRYGYSSLGVYVANADGSRARELMRNAAEPSWSPDGRRIAYTITIRPGIYVMNPDGTRPRLLRRGPGAEIEWSPDGRRLLFTASTAGFEQHVFVMNADGSGARRLTRQCASDLNPTWSPDGRKIAFTCSRTASSYEDIYAVNVDGTGLRRLTSNPRGDMYPAWSPDSQWIAYVGYKGEENGVRVMRSDGTGHQRITLSTHDSVPTWAPRRN